MHFHALAAYRVSKMLKRWPIHTEGYSSMLHKGKCETFMLKYEETVLGNHELYS